MGVKALCHGCPLEEIHNQFMRVFFFCYYQLTHGRSTVLNKRLVIKLEQFPSRFYRLGFVRFI